MTIIYRYLSKRILVASAIVVSGTCFPIILAAVCVHVPPSLLYSRLAWPILYGIVPTTIYVILPVAVSIAITWCYANLVDDSIVAIFYSARLSAYSVVSPAISIALAATVVGYFLSCVVAPHSLGRIHDVMHLIKNSLVTSLLQPNHFYVLSDGAHIFEFERWAGKHIEHVFIQQIVTKGEEREEQTIVAERGDFLEMDQESVLALSDGYIQIFKPASGNVSIVDFNRIIQRIGMGGITPPARNWTGIFEVSTSEFLARLASLDRDDNLRARWFSEAVKRLGIPALAISHTLLGLGLIMLRSRSPRRREVPHIYFLILVLMHGLFLALAEGVIFLDVSFGWSAILIIPIEAIVGIVLISGWSRNALSAVLGDTWARSDSRSGLPVPYEARSRPVEEFGLERFG